jgi:PEP-CTERM motif
MKKLLLILTVSFASLAAFAQGKILFTTDSLHLVFYNPYGDPVPPFPGQGVDTAHMPPGYTLLADLYIGTTSTSLSLISSTTFSAIPGKWNQLSVTVPIPGGTSIFVMAQVRDSFSPAESVWTPTYSPNSLYWGRSEVFPFTLGSSITYPPMYAQGTWPVGTFNMDQYGPGSRGAIPVPYVPEPSAVALAGLASVAILFRRRQSATLRPNL